MKDLILLACVDELASSNKKAHNYQAVNLRSASAELERNGRGVNLWDQHLKIGGVHHRRWGKVNKYDSKTIVDKDGNIEGTDKRSKSILKQCDVFNLPLAEHGSFIAGRVNASFPRLFMHPPVLAGSTKSDVVGVKSEVVGVWKINSAFATIKFSDELGGMPTDIVWRVADKDLEAKAVLEKGRVYSFTKTRWKEVKNGDDKLFVPVQFIIDSPGSRANSAHQEARVIVQWRFGKDVKTAMPSLTSDDWREPMRRLFDEDFNLSFSQFEADFREKKSSR